MSYQTKVLRPANLKGLSACRDAIEQAISEAEQNGDNGDVSITAILKGGSIVSVRKVVNKTVPMPDPNT